MIMPNFMSSPIPSPGMPGLPEKTQELPPTAVAVVKKVNPVLSKLQLIGVSLVKNVMT
jgi:hypothetical protein